MEGLGNQIKIRIAVVFALPPTVSLATAQIRYLMPEN